jgi:hypothetical protein
VLNAERGRPIDRVSQRAIGEALSMLLQRAEFQRIGAARGAVVRAELEAEAAQRRVESVRESLAEVEASYHESMRVTSQEIAAMWSETHDDEVEGA